MPVSATPAPTSGRGFRSQCHVGNRPQAQRSGPRATNYKSEGPDARPRGTPVSGHQAPVGYRIVRYWGLAKTAAQVMTLFALWNLWMKRRTLLAIAG